MHAIISVVTYRNSYVYVSSPPKLSLSLYTKTVLRRSTYSDRQSIDRDLYAPLKETDQFSFH